MDQLCVQRCVLQARVEQHSQLPVPEFGGRVPRTENCRAQHNPHFGHAVANAVFPVRAGHAVSHRAGGQPRDQAEPVLGDDGEHRAVQGRSQRPVPEHQHLQFPRRNGPSADEHMPECAVRRAVLRAVVPVDGETARPLAGDRTAPGAEQGQGGHVRAETRRPARTAHGQVLHSHRQRREHHSARSVGSYFAGGLPRQNQRRVGFFRQQCQSSGGRKYQTTVIVIVYNMNSSRIDRTQASLCCAVVDRHPLPKLQGSVGVLQKRLQQQALQGKGTVVWMGMVPDTSLQSVKSSARSLYQT